ncbi:MAG: N-formylglutamate amidohydrolase [Candidatus Moranbacteria bacterium]|nr:N-formylglutamate amidohydrolase [Candidatus Moranbacteria bacterium]
MNIETDRNNIRNEGFCLVVESKTPSPIVISVPHDGLSGGVLSGLLSVREKGMILKDSNVWPIAKDILMTCPANAVQGLIPRDFVDYNRSYEKALEDKALRGSYDSYHRNIGHLLQTAIRNHGKRRCLLLDIHGFGIQPRYAPSEGYDIILGTNNRSSIHFDDVDREMAGYLSDLGYRVFLPAEMPVDRRLDSLNGGYTNRRYSGEFGINGIQIEIARKFRTK